MCNYAVSLVCVVCRHSHCDASGDGRFSQLASAPTRVGGAASMASANSTIAINSILGGRPHTPTQSSANLPRTVTSASTVQLTGSGGGIAAQLSRVGSKMQLTAAGTTGMPGIRTTCFLHAVRLHTVQWPIRFAAATTTYRCRTALPLTPCNNGWYCLLKPGAPLINRRRSYKCARATRQ